MVASFVERRRAWLKVSATGIGAPSLAVGSRVSGVTMPDKTVLRGFDMALYLGCKFVVDPTQKLADDLEPHAAFQKSPDRCHDALPGAFASHEDITVVGVSNEPKASPCQFAIQFVEDNVGKQWRKRPPLR